ncbi:MAG: hypothetical protein WCC06_01340 [Candidatus Aminicenantales bacterium]
MAILGWVLIILGVLFIVVALAGAFTEIVKKTVRNAAAGKGLTSTVVETYTKLLSAIKELLAEILKGPKWFLAFLIGLALIYIGARLQSGLSIF